MQCVIAFMQCVIVFMEYLIVFIQYVIVFLLYITVFDQMRRGGVRACNLLLIDAIFSYCPTCSQYFCYFCKKWILYLNAATAGNCHVWLYCFCKAMYTMWETYILQILALPTHMYALCRQLSRVKFMHLSSNPPVCQNWGWGWGVKPMLTMPRFRKRLFM